MLNQALSKPFWFEDILDTPFQLQEEWTFRLPHGFLIQKLLGSEEAKADTAEYLLAQVGIAPKEALINPDKSSFDLSKTLLTFDEKALLNHAYYIALSLNHEHFKNIVTKDLRHRLINEVGVEAYEFALNKAPLLLRNWPRVLDPKFFQDFLACGDFTGLKRELTTQGIILLNLAIDEVFLKKLLALKIAPSYYKSLCEPVYSILKEDREKLLILIQKVLKHTRSVI